MNPKDGETLAEKMEKKRRFQKSIQAALMKKYRKNQLDMATEASEVSDEQPLFSGQESADELSSQGSFKGK